MSAGMVFCYYNWMIGSAVHHVNEPMNGSIAAGDDNVSPRRFTFHLKLCEFKSGL